MLSPEPTRFVLNKSFSPYRCGLSKIDNQIPNNSLISGPPEPTSTENWLNCSSLMKKGKQEGNGGI